MRVGKKSGRISEISDNPIRVSDNPFYSFNVSKKEKTVVKFEWFSSGFLRSVIQLIVSHCDLAFVFPIVIPIQIILIRIILKHWSWTPITFPVLSRIQKFTLPTLFPSSTLIGLVFPLCWFNDSLFSSSWS